MSWRPAAPFAGGHLRRFSTATSTHSYRGSQDEEKAAHGADDGRSKEGRLRAASPPPPTGGGLLPAPATSRPDSTRRKESRTVTLAGRRGLRVHWARFKRRLGEGTAPSESSVLEQSTGAGSSVRRSGPAAESAEDDGVDEVVVDRTWAEEMRSSCPSDHGQNPPKSGNSHSQSQSQQQNGTNTDHDSDALRLAEGFWGCCSFLIIIRWCVHFRFCFRIDVRAHIFRYN
jgi:osomolarity two-component system, sensor histidine kinase SLN1